MLEMLLNPKRAERKPWELFFVGFAYSAISLILANLLFASNPVFSKHISVLVITFTVMFSMPFFYMMIKLEEERNYNEEGRSLIMSHGRSISALMWLFFGFVMAYSLVYVLFPGMVGQSFEAQLEQYCQINMPNNMVECVTKNGGVFAGGFANAYLTGEVTTKQYALSIFVNNIYVMIFSLIFSLIFGAGAIFILAWNASVIATAVGIFAKSSITNLPAALSRYMIHGLPEISAYFVAALAGGIIGVALIKHDMRDKLFWKAVKDSLNLVLLSFLLLVVGLLIEVFITPKFF